MTRRTRSALPCLLAAALVLAACGGGSGSDSANESSGGGGATIRLGFSAWPGWFPWQVAEEAGLFTKAGLKVELTYFESYLDSLNALAGGRLDANSQTLNDTISSVAGGAKERIVLVNDNSTGNDKIVVGPGIDKVEDLKGKSVGAEQGTVDHYLLLLGMQRAGLGPSDISFKPLETGAAAAAFASGQLDAVGVFAPFTTKALEREGAKALFTSADFPGAIPDHLVVSDSLATARAADVQKLVDVWFETLDYIAGNRAEANKIMAERAGVSVSDYETYDQGTRIFTLDENLAAFEPGSDVTRLDFNARQIAKFLLDVELIDREPDLSAILDPTFVKARAAAG